MHHESDATAESGGACRLRVVVLVVAENSNCSLARPKTKPCAEHSDRRAEVATVGISPGARPASGFLGGRAPARALVGAPFESVPEPGLFSDESDHGEGIVLGAFEGLGVVEHRVFCVALEVCEGEDLEEEGVAPEAGGEACDGRGCATDHASDLAVCGSVDESGGDGDEELGTLEEVGEGEGLLGEGGPAGGATVASDAATVRSEEGAEALVGEAAWAGEGVLWAVASWAEGGSETALNLEGVNWPAHGSG